MGRGVTGDERRAEMGTPWSWWQEVGLWYGEQVPSAPMHTGRVGWRCMNHMEWAFAFPDAL